MTVEQEDPIVLRVLREVCGHNSRVRGWEWSAAPPHVRRFVGEGASFGEVCAELASLGYAFGVEVRSEDVSLVAWMGVAPTLQEAERALAGGPP